MEPTERRPLPEAEEEEPLSPAFFCFSLSRRDMWGSDASTPVVPLAWRAEGDHITVEMWGWTLRAGSGSGSGREKGRAKPALCGPQDGEFLSMARSSGWHRPQDGEFLSMARSSGWRCAQDGAVLKMAWLSRWRLRTWKRMEPEFRPSALHSPSWEDGALRSAQLAP